MSIKTVIVEDEEHPRRRLKRMLASYDELEIIGEAVDAPSAIALLNETRPELLFLDIQLPGGNGFDVLAKTKCRPMVVFITAYDEFAIKAFEENALDYILKPASPQRLESALRRVLTRRTAIESSLLSLLRSTAAKSTYLKRFAVNMADEILIIQESDVFCLRAEGKGVTLCTFDREYLFSMTLKELERSLDPEVFLRVHKSCIVAIDKVRKISRWFHGDLIIQLEDKRKTKVRVGRSYREGLKNLLGT